MNYEELENIPFTYIDGDKSIEVKAVGIDFDIGITIVNAKDSKEYVLCILGPLAPQNKDKKEKYFLGYQKVFDFTIEQIKNGALIRETFIEMTNKATKRIPGYEPSIESCAFGQ